MTTRSVTVGVSIYDTSMEKRVICSVSRVEVECITLYMTMWGSLYFLEGYKTLCVVVERYIFIGGVPIV